MRCREFLGLERGWCQLPVSASPNYCGRHAAERKAYMTETLRRNGRRGAA